MSENPQPNTPPEPSPMSSKKFRAFVVAEISWKILLALVVLLSFLSGGGIGLYGFLASLTIILIAGFVEVTYIGKQADLDKYVKIATLTVKGTTSILSGDKDATTHRPDMKEDRKPNGA